MKRINLKELANLLNLSTSSVSKALRDSHEISEETKKKVREFAVKHNYSPNPYATSLRKKKSKTIAVILPEVADNYFSLAINGIQKVAEARGYHLLIYLSHEKYSIEKAVLEECSNGRVDGVLISISSETTDHSHLQKLVNENIPLVFFDRAPEDFNASKVITNDYDCGYFTALHLIEDGCTNPVFLSMSSALPICHRRAEGFKAAVLATGIASDPNKLVHYCDGTEEESMKKIQELFESKNRPDGVVASVERLAIQTYMVAQESEINIPKEVKVIAFSTLETAPILNPPLSTITQPAYDTGTKAAELLFQRIEKPLQYTQPECVVLPSIFMERKSCIPKSHFS